MRAKWYGVLGVVAAVILASTPAMAIDIGDLNPQPPPGLGDKILMFVNWLYYLAIAACVAGAIAGTALLVTGRDSGKYVLAVALVGLAILAALPSIIAAI